MNRKNNKSVTKKDFVDYSTKSFLVLKRSNKLTFNFAVCRGRHKIPWAVDGAIFPSTVSSVTDVTGLYNCVCDNIPDNATHINLYITGLTVAVLAVVKFCYNNNISLTCYHYNRDTGDYYPQMIF